MQQAVTKRAARAPVLHCDLSMHCCSADHDEAYPGLYEMRLDRSVHSTVSQGRRMDTWSVTNSMAADIMA